MLLMDNAGDPESAGAADWLAAAQSSDGGWGALSSEWCRDVSTLAATTALASLAGPDAKCVRMGVEFLRGRTSAWESCDVDDLPLAGEFTMPRLARRAAGLGLALDTSAWDLLGRLAGPKSKYLASQALRAPVAATYSWECWGGFPSPHLVDSVGSVGTNPAASSAWLAKAAPYCQEEPFRFLTGRVREYLRDAAASTGVGNGLVVPATYPVEQFEESFALHALYVAGIASRPALAPLVRAHLESAARAAAPEGFGWSWVSACDGDDTGVSIAVLARGGVQRDAEVLGSYQSRDGWFTTFPAELNPSLSTTAHCLEAALHIGRPADGALEQLVGRQAPDGSWPTDKWNATPLYTTMCAVCALAVEGGAAQDAALRSAACGLLRRQSEDGGWELAGRPAALPTAYAVLALCQAAARLPGMRAEITVGVARAERFLAAFLAASGQIEECWTGKDSYGMPRADRVSVLAAYAAAAETVASGVD